MTAIPYTPDTNAAIGEVRLRDSNGNVINTTGAGFDASGALALPANFDSLPMTTSNTYVGGFLTQVVYTRTIGGHTYTLTKTQTNDGTNYTGGSDSGWVYA